MELRLEDAHAEYTYGSSGPDPEPPESWPCWCSVGKDHPEGSAGVQPTPERHQDNGPSRSDEYQREMDRPDPSEF